MTVFTDQFLAKVAIFCCFDVCSVRPPQICQVQAKISTVRPVLPDYRSASYDYDIINSNIKFSVILLHRLDFLCADPLYLLAIFLCIYYLYLLYDDDLLQKHCRHYIFFTDVSMLCILYLFP